MPNGKPSDIIYDKAHACQIQNSRLIPCNYHKKRVNCPIYATQHKATRKNGRVAGLPSTHDIKELARLLYKRQHPAGGWYLLREQRDWLGENLFQILRDKHDGTTVNILEAGVAGYIHHYTYLSIVADVLQRLNNGLRISLTVVDRCAYPIMQIAAVDKLLASGFTPPREVRIDDASFSIDEHFTQVMNIETRAFERISMVLSVGDLNNSNSMMRLGSFDIITEHFLPPVLKFRSGEIAEIRDVYSKILAPGGRLLSASTIVSTHPFYSEYANIHRNCGFENIEEASELVWNPFSVESELIEKFLKRENPRGFDVPLENILSVYYLAESG